MAALTEIKIKPKHWANIGTKPCPEPVNENILETETGKYRYEKIFGIFFFSCIIRRKNLLFFMYIFVN